MWQKAKIRMKNCNPRRMPEVIGNSGNGQVENVRQTSGEVETSQMEKRTNTERKKAGPQRRVRAPKGSPKFCGTFEVLQEDPAERFT